MARGGSRQRDVSGIGQVASPLSARERRIDNALCLADETAQMRLVMKAFGVDLVNILGSGGARREPAAARGYFHPADGRVVARRFRQYLVDRFAGKFGDADLLPIELANLCLLHRRGGLMSAIR